MEKKTVLVTGIGGNVGQGIIRNILAESYNVRIIGINIAEMSAGNHLVDRFYKVPFSNNDEYIPSVLNIVQSENVDLIIPSTDLEMYYLAANKQTLNCVIADAGVMPAKIYLDKLETYRAHHEAGIPFVETIYPSQYKGQFSKAIAKPREGRGSRGILKNISDVSGLSDDNYIVQPMYEGVEYTTAVYASYISGAFHALITLERSLENGATTYCRVIKDYDSQFREIAEKMINHFGIRGAFNIQSIVTEDHEIHPFEINCRISGTNSIRSHFGFKDVAWTVSELMYATAPSTPVVTNGVAYRYLADVIYPDGIVAKDNTDNFLNF